MATRLKLDIKGKSQNLFAKLFLKLKARNAGVLIHSINKVSGGHLEVIAFGDKDNLWEIINWTKGRTNVFVFLNEVNFEFSDSPER